VSQVPAEPPEAPRLRAEDVLAPPGGDADPGAPGAEGEGAPKHPLEDARRGTPWTLTTYFAEGLPYSIVHQVSAELFASFNASLAAISYTSFFGLAWNFKFVWSPLVERYGSLRRWIVGTEILIGLAMLAIAPSAGQGNLRAVALALVAVAILGATQDIAVDGYYLVALEKPAQASLSGTRVGAYRVALLVGKSALVALAGFTTWRVSFFAGGALMLALAAVNHVILRPLGGAIPNKVAANRAALIVEPPARAASGPRPSTSAGQAAVAGGSAPEPLRAARPAIGERVAQWIVRRFFALAFVDSFLSFLKKPQIAVSIAFIVLFKAGDALLFNMSVPFLKHLGLDTDMRGLLSAPSLIASIAGTTIGGVWIRRATLAKTLVPVALIQTFAIPLYTALALARPTFRVIAVSVSIEQFIAGVGNAALLVFLMRRAEGAHKTAHFAIGTALMSIPVTLAGAFSGHLAEAAGFAKFFVVAFLIAIPGALLARVVPKD